MHPRLTELLDYLDRQTVLLRTTFDSVPAGRRADRPAPDRWSAAEIVHHLTIVEGRLAQRVAGLIAQARALPPENDTTSLFPMAAIKRIEDRGLRVRSPEAAEPRDTDPTRVWDDLVVARTAFISVVATGDGLQLGAVSAPHAVLGEFTGYEWIAFAGAHTARHTEQMREITAHPAVA